MVTTPLAYGSDLKADLKVEAGVEYRVEVVALGKVTELLDLGDEVRDGNVPQLKPKT